MKCNVHIIFRTDMNRWPNHGGVQDLGLFRTIKLAKVYSNTRAGYWRKDDTFPCRVSSLWEAPLPPRSTPVNLPEEGRCDQLNEWLLAAKLAPCLHWRNQRFALWIPLRNMIFQAHSKTAKTLPAILCCLRAGNQVSVAINATCVKCSCQKVRHCVRACLEVR